MIAVMYSNFSPSEAHLARLEAIAGGGAVTVVEDERQALACAGRIEVVLGHRYLRQLLSAAPALRWIQSTAAGVDHLPLAEIAARGIVLTRNPLNTEAIAHHLVASIWAVLRRIPDAVRAQARGEWVRPPAMLPLPRTALVLGMGEIGRAVAALLRGLGLHVRGCARSGTAAQRAACDEFLFPHQWRAALGDTDVCILAMPLTGQTRGCFGADEIAALPPHAVLANVARSGLLDGAALLRALEAGRLGGAALDVLDPVPPPDAPIWKTPGLLITPKVAAFHPAMQDRLEAWVEAQLQRHVDGRALHEIVDVIALNAPPEAGTP